MASGLHAGVGGDRLEAGIQQRGVHAILACWERIGPGSPTSASTVLAGSVGGVRRTQTGEGRTVLHAALVEPLPHLGAVHPARVRGQQRRHVQRGRLVLIVERRAGRRWRAVRVPVLGTVSTAKSTTPGDCTVATAPTGVSSSSSSICSKRTSRTSDASPRTVWAAANAISQ